MAAGGAGPAPRPATPAPTLESPPDVAIAAAPRTTGPEAHTAAPAPPAPAPVTPAPAAAAPATEDPALIAMVPQQRGARTLYRASAEPASAAIERAAERVKSGQTPGWDDQRIGIEIR